MDKYLLDMHEWTTLVTNNFDLYFGMLKTVNILLFLEKLDISHVRKVQIRRRRSVNPFQCFISWKQLAISTSFPE